MRWFAWRGRSEGGELRAKALVAALIAGCVWMASPWAMAAQQESALLYHDLFSVSFPTANEGWTCGRQGTIAHTGDGGATWSRQKSGTLYTLSSICFVDENKGWAVGDAGTILHTGDGGENWSPQGLNLEQRFLMGVDFADALNGWAVSERGAVVYTRDGGVTWAQQFKGKDLVLRAVSFCDARNGWAVGEGGYIYHTADGGASWEHQAGEFYLSDETWLMVAGDFLFDVYAVSPREAWVAGLDGFVGRTLDGGATWEEVVDAGVPKTHLFGVATNGGDSVFIGGTSLLMTSQDKGARFTVAVTEPGITYGWIGDITRRGDAGFVAVGRRGWVYLTDAAGMVWRRAGGEAAGADQ